MSRGYLKKEQDISDKIKEMSEYAEEILGIENFSEKLADYITKGYFIIPTPCWTNFYKDSKYSSISCFGMYVGDSVDRILYSNSEMGMESKVGGGTSGYFALRPRGSEISGGGITNGAVSFMETFQTTSRIISQASRRGHFAATLDIHHGDIDEFLRIRGDGHPIQDLSFAVSIDDKFMEDLLQEDKRSMDLWARIIESRFATGFPYIFFKDTVNKNKPDVYKNLDLNVWHSNMCCEIALPNSDEESFVCCLLGMNLELYDEWKDTDAVEVGIYFMDAMLTDFINKNKDVPYMDRAVKFAERHRAVGLGASGYHSYLQSKNIPFESFEANLHNKMIFKNIRDQAQNASIKMAIEFGKPEILSDSKYNRRHSTLMAIAPNTSSSFIIAQQSQSIEPYVSNYYVKDVAKTRVEIKNPYLKKLLKEKNQDTDEVWKSILFHSGSVLHLDFLSEEEKNVFKTYTEINQYEIINQASDRQKYIDQSQSLNLMIPVGTDPDDVSAVMLYAWQKDIKTLYYQLNVNVAQDFTNTLFKEECVACAG